MATDTDSFDMGQLDNPPGAFLANHGKIETSKVSGLELGDGENVGKVSEPDQAMSESKPVDPDIEDNIVSLLEEGRKNVAIKLYRRQTGVGLKEAKDFVETLAAKYEISPKAAGCAGMVLLMVLVPTIIRIGIWVLPG